MRRALLAAIAALIAGATPSLAYEPPPALVVFVDGVSFPRLLADPDLRALASHGGVALMNGRTPVREATQLVIDSADTTPAPMTAHSKDLGRA